MLSFNEIGLVIAALFPAIALMIYIFKKDRAEKEPIGLIVLLFFAGVIIAKPAGWTEGLVSPIISNLFSNVGYVEDGTRYLGTVPFYIYTFLDNFFGVALIEEGFKFIALFFLTYKNKNFNSLFDGMVYSVAVSLGFAAIENVMYAFAYGWETVLMRMILSVPAHMFFSVLMGYFYSFWNVFRHVDTLEKDAKQKGMISASKKPVNKGKQLALAIVVPTIIHGFFDFCLSADSTFFLVVFYIFVIALYIFCFMRIHKFSKSDVMYGHLLLTVFLKRNQNVLQLVRSEAFQHNLTPKGLEDTRDMLNTYYALTFDADPKEETSLEALLHEATE